MCRWSNPLLVECNASRIHRWSNPWLVECITNRIHRWSNLSPVECIADLFNLVFLCAPNVECITDPIHRYFSSTATPVYTGVRVTRRRLAGDDVMHPSRLSSDPSLLQSIANLVVICVTRRHLAGGDVNHWSCLGVIHSSRRLARGNVMHPSRFARGDVIRELNVLQRVAVCCSVLQWCDAWHHSSRLTVAIATVICNWMCCSVLQRVAVCCSVLQCVALVWFMTSSITSDSSHCYCHM